MTLRSAGDDGTSRRHVRWLLSHRCWSHINTSVMTTLLGVMSRTRRKETHSLHCLDRTLDKSYVFCYYFTLTFWQLSYRQLKFCLRTMTLCFVRFYEPKTNKSTWRAHTFATANPVRIWNPHPKSGLTPNPDDFQNLTETFLTNDTSGTKF